jgi:titin
VASINSGGGLSTFSNYGATTVDVGAPGEGIYSTLPNGRYGSMSGTSMATPHVAGTAALVLAQNPSWSATQVISRIESTVTPDVALAGKTVTGGIVNAGQAVTGTATPSPPAAVGNLNATAVSSTQVNLSWSDVSGETGFYVERSTDGTTWSQIAATAAGVTSYQDSGLSASTTYSYRVRAFNGSGPGGYSAVASTTTPAAPVGTVLYSDSFGGTSVNPAWKFVGGSWAQSNGMLAQTSTGAGDPKKALLTDQTYPASVVVAAKVRVDSWAGGDSARAGVSLYNDPSTGKGYNLVFHSGTGTVQFLDDGVAWGNSYSFAWAVGAWYWFKLEALNGTLYGKVWQDGTAEPGSWMFTQAGWADRQGGAPGLNGGSNAGATASFTGVIVTTPVAAPAAPTGLTATASSPSQINLSWSGVSGATSYAVQRSPDGSSWAPLASGLTTASYADTGLQPATAYFYRVQASNAAGSGPFSATASATTQPLAAPTGLTATASSSSQVSLSWGAVGGAAAYAVQRSPDGSTWALLASGLTATSYADTGLQPATAYFYRVQASSGTSSSPFSAAVSVTTLAALTGAGGVLYSDSFGSSTVNPAWKFVGGSWAQSNGVLAQTSTGAGDPKKALLTDQTYPASVVVTAKVRVDSWAGGDAARAGVSLYDDPSTGKGYNLVFHSSTGTVQFLDDGVAWGNSYAFSWSVGAWYWFKLEALNGTLYGKVWQDGAPEPSSWMFTQAGWADRQGGAPGLNGGSNNGATASFASLTVSTPAVAPGAPIGLAASASSASQINLSWSAVSGATSYAVQRSLDGTTWTQLASGLTATSYADAGLQAATTYYYRVEASNSVGSSPFSATVSATTPAASSGTVLYSDGFGSSTVKPAWKFAGGSWAQSAGVLAQTSTGAGDPKKALLTDQAYPANLVVTAKVRVDYWAGGDAARAGVSLYNDPATGRGYNLVFHSNTGTVQFLDDGVAWGNSYAFNWAVGSWYWFKLEALNGVLYGKVWQDGTPEPAAWMFTQSGWADRQGGAPGLNGGSNAGATASFASLTVTSV